MRRSSPSSKFVPCLFEGGSAYKLLHYAVPIRILISLALTTIFSRSFCDHLWCEQLQTSRGRITTTQKINSLKRRQSLLQNEPRFLPNFFSVAGFQYLNNSVFRGKKAPQILITVLFLCVTGSSSCKIWAWWKSFVTSSLANLKRILLFCRAQGHFYQSLNSYPELYL